MNVQTVVDYINKLHNRNLDSEIRDKLIIMILNAFEKSIRHMPAQNPIEHKWIVFSTAVYPADLMLECETCGAQGLVVDSTEDEWKAAFHAPSNEYEWTGGYERVVVLSGNIECEDKQQM
jgi:hypothetical protein